MAFTWSSSISTGSLAMTTALQEIRNNLDYVDNNLACVTHNGTYDSNDDATINTGYNSTVNSTANSTVDSYADAAARLYHDSTVNSAYCATY